MKKLRFVLVCLLVAAWVNVSLGQEEPTTATKYLKAWMYKDYPGMYAVSSSEVRSSLTEAAFGEAAAALPAPASTPQIVEGDARTPGSTLYVEYTVAGADAPTRTSLQLSADGIQHPELLARGATRATAGGAAPTEKLVGGETADSILAKMEKATEAAETLTADVMLKGSLMGQTLNETGKLLYRRPDSMRLEFSSFLLNSNGGKSILYLQSANAYMDAGSLGGLELSPGLGTSTAELREKYNITLRNKSELEGVPVFELHLKPPTSGGALGSLMGGLGGSGNMRMWVSADTWWPVRVKLDNVTADYRNVQVNARGVTEASFDFTPPKGATPLSLGGLLGGGLPAGE